MPKIKKKRKKASRLSDMEFDEISFVTRPANQHSKVVLWKSDSEPEEILDASMFDDEPDEEKDVMAIARHYLEEKEDQPMTKEADISKVRDVASNLIVDQVNKRAQELRKYDRTLTPEAARVAVLREDPSLYLSYRQIRRVS